MAFLEKRSDVSEQDVKRLLDVFSKLNNTCVWSKVSKEDFTVKRFELGFVNDICGCKLTDEAQKRLCTTLDDAVSIVVKFAPKNSLTILSRLEFAVCNMIMSERKITPRLLYVDEECMINEFEPNRDYKQKDDFDTETVEQLARILARIHTAKPPISSNAFQTWGDVFEDKEGTNPAFQSVLKREYLTHLEKESFDVKEKYYSFFAKVDFLPQFNAYNRKLIQAVQSPLVFSHVDFNRNNRLVQETVTADGSIEKKLFIIDFDYSTFTYRGLDLGRFFSNYKHEADIFGNEGFPEDEEMELFLREYQGECGRIEGKHYLLDEGNSIEQLIREAKVFTLSTYVDFFFALMMYTTDPNGPEKNRYLKYAFDRYSAYLTQKQRFIEDGTIPYILGKIEGNGN